MGDAHRKLPGAHTLFYPDELPWYFAWWQEQNHVKVFDPQQVFLPTAYEYGNYIEWRVRLHQEHVKASSSSQKQEQAAPTPPSSSPVESASKEPPATQELADDLVKAARCQHALHPGHPVIAPASEEDLANGTEKRIVQRCPKCTLSIHVRIIAALWQRWAVIGGPWRNCPPGVRGKDYQQQRSAFRRRKVDMVNAIDKLDLIAAQEDAWEAAHPDVEIAEAVKYLGASRSLSAFRAGNFCPEGFNHNMMLPPRTPESTSNGKGKGKEKKRLSYSPGTPEDSRHRPNGRYARDTRHYDPKSPHACPDKEGWLDTALQKDWRFNVRQCRLLLCDKDPSKTGVTYRELRDDKSKDRLLATIDLWLAEMPQEYVPKWQAEMQDTSEIFVVWGNEEQTEDEGAGFFGWEQIESLVGSDLEAYALEIGEIDDQDYANRAQELEEKRMKISQNQPEHEEEQDDDDDDDELTPDEEQDDGDEMLTPDEDFDPDEAFVQASSDDDMPGAEKPWNPDDAFLQVSSDPENFDEEMF